MTARLLIYGGTFDPPHIGHDRALVAAQHAFAPDETWIVPTGSNVTYRRASVTPAAARLEVCRRWAVTRAASVCDAEITGMLSGRTVDLIDYARRQRPGHLIGFVVGADQLDGIAGWHDSQRLLAGCRLLVAPRPGHDVDRAVLAACQLGADVTVLDCAAVAISSSEIRAGRQVSGLRV